jgi:hypothetical protein
VSSRTRLLPFVQLEFTHALGPVPGRYVVADDGRPGEADPEGAEVLLLDVAAAPAVTRRRARAARGAATQPATPEAAPVSLAVATHVKVALAGDGDEAVRWVQACREDPALQVTWVAAALELVNRAIRAHRASCGDPYFTELNATDPRVVRIGYGSAHEVSRGRWQTAFVVEPRSAPKLGQAQRTAPSEVVAAALAGRPISLQADELVLRALLDLDQDRIACAALQLHAAARMLAAELGPDGGSDLEALGARLGELTRHLPLPDGAVTPAELHGAAARLRTIAEAWRADVLVAFRARV